MRTRIAIFIALTCLALPLLAQEQEAVATIQFTGEKAEAISSFSWGVSQSRSTTGEGGSAGEATFGDFSFTKPVTPLSNALFLGCTTGRRFPSVVIQVAKKKGKDKGREFYTFKLSDVLVSSYRLNGSEGESTDTTTLTYANVEYTLMNP